MTADGGSSNKDQQEKSPITSRKELEYIKGPFLTKSPQIHANKSILENRVVGGEATPKTILIQ